MMGMQMQLGTNPRRGFRYGQFAHGSASHGTADAAPAGDLEPSAPSLPPTIKLTDVVVPGEPGPEASSLERIRFGIDLSLTKLGSWERRVDGRGVLQKPHTRGFDFGRISLGLQANQCFDKQIAEHTRFVNNC